MDVNIIDRIVVDIDGTLGPFPLGSYYKGDTVEERLERYAEMKAYCPAVPILNFLAKLYHITLLTGRSIQFQNITMQWLQVHAFTYHTLEMCPQPWIGYESYLTFKITQLQRLNPILFIDDDLTLIQRVQQDEVPLQAYCISGPESWNLEQIMNLLNRTKGLQDEA